MARASRLAGNGIFENIRRWSGAAWERTGEKAGAYLSVAIDDPSFIQAIRANLFQSDAEKNVWALHWSRPSKRAE
ncbi:DUF736 domain-containing protein [Mesorhizobium sp. M7A.F.Ca.US.014.04.1.1]|nr:DUF736 domain-containing protein [Mesorhizobium sp. M7A.F.Ca.US.014.04.1.1]